MGKIIKETLIDGQVDGRQPEFPYFARDSGFINYFKC